MNTSKTTTTETTRANLAVVPDAKPIAVQKMTFAQAQDAAVGHARELYAAAVQKRGDLMAKLETELGGQTLHLDESIVEQGEKWLARLQVTSARQVQPNYGSTNEVKKLLDKAIITIAPLLGTLRASAAIRTLTAKVRETPDESEFVRENYQVSDADKNVLAYVQPNIRKAVGAWLEAHVEIIPEPKATVTPISAGAKKASSNAAGAKKATVKKASAKR